MKKFKTSAEKIELNNLQLQSLLAEKNLLYNALVQYSHVPLGLIVCGVFGLSLLLIKSPIDISALLVLPYLAIGGTALLYMTRSWLAFQSHRSQLQNVRNSFVGRRTLPLLFGSLQLFLSAVLGLNTLVLTLLCWALLSLYLRNSKPLFYGLYFLLLSLLPLSLNIAPENIAAIAPGVILGAALMALSQKKSGYLFLDKEAKTAV